MKHLIAALLIALPSPVLSQADVLAREAADMLAEAAQRLDAVEGSSDRIEALTDTVRAYEAGLAAMREGLRQTALRERAISERLAVEDAELAGLLTLLQAVSRQTGTQAAIHPGGARETLRAGMLTASLVPALQLEASGLAADLDELKTLGALQLAGSAALEAGLEDVRAARLALSTAVSERSDLPPLLATDEAAMQALINSSETLAGFADSLLPDGAIEVVKGVGAWDFPVTGQTLRAFNEADAAGVRRPGLVIATDAKALVTAPSDATVRFSGEVPGQGAVTILEPEPGALVILAGMEQSFVRLSQIVSAGDPIGLMGGSEGPGQEILNGVLSQNPPFGAETLYMEVRQGRTPVNPAELLRRGDE